MRSDKLILETHGELLRRWREKDIQLRNNNITWEDYCALLQTNISTNRLLVGFHLAEPQIFCRIIILRNRMFPVFEPSCSSLELSGTMSGVRLLAVQWCPNQPQRQKNQENMTFWGSPHSWRGKIHGFALLIQAGFNPHIVSAAVQRILEIMIGVFLP